MLPPDQSAGRPVGQWARNETTMTVDLFIRDFRHIHSFLVSIVRSIRFIRFSVL